MKSVLRPAMAVRLAAAGLLVALLAGCSRRVDVFARDAETGEPLRSGRVCVSNGRMDPFDFFPAGPSCDDITRGKARVEWATRRSPGITVTSAGYLPWRGDLAGKTSGDGPVRLSTELYRAPAPTATLVVPAGFRGLIKIHFQSGPGAQPSPVGQRDFVWIVAPEKVNAFAWPDVLRHRESTDFIGMFNDGTRMPPVTPANPDAVTLRYVGYVNVGRRDPITFYCVGTRTEAEAWQRPMPRHASEVDMSWVEGFGVAPQP